MAHIHGRTVKNVEAPRPMKSSSRSSLKSYMVVEEIIQLIENIALNLQNGIISPDQMAMMVQNLKINGPQVEAVAKEPLDRAFVVFRNASQDERLNIMTRLNLLELIELRAKSWVDNGINAYYKSKHASELPEAQLMQHPQYVHTTHAASDGTYICTSPSFGGGATAGGINNLSETVAANAAIIASVGSPQQTHMLLNPGEVIRNSGTFPKPTKIPGKPYCKDEVVIRNSDSGKVMGIKGRRVHMIEELSETIISFQRVNPGAKERLVQITGPAEDKINYAKQLIEDTIRRNASPVRWEPAPAGAAGGGSCSSLASSNSDEHVQLRSNTANNTLANRLSFNSAQNFMTATAAAQNLAAMQNQAYMNMAGNQMIASPTGPPPMAMATGKNMRPSQQILLHSYSTNDASVGEYKYTVTVGQHIIKITGDSCDLVRSAKLVLDDYFSSAEFLASREAGGGFDGSVVSPISTPTTPMAGGPHHFIVGSTPLKASSTPLADSGVGLNYMSGNSPNEGEDEVFVEANAASNGGLVRSRRSHFSRKESSPDNTTSNVGASKVNKKPATAASTDKSSRIVIEMENLLYYAQSPHSWTLPADWARICEKFPYLVRNKDENDESNRFDGEKYLKLMKSSSKRNLDLDGNDETTEDNDDPIADNE